MPVSFTALLSEIESCQLCAGSLPHGVRPVVQLYPDAKVLIAGQAPGRRVHESGVPFDDPSGERLRRWMGVERDEFYDAHEIAILPMGFCYPGTGMSGDLPPRPECAPAWRGRAMSALTGVRLTLVIGMYAQKYHLPGAGKTLTAAVSDWRRFWPDAVPMPHPSPRNRRWLAQNPFFEAEVVPALQARIRDLLGRPA
ncbi:MAG: uracil-DNA glycosylase family protein [Acidobacteriota bacterium]